MPDAVKLSNVGIAPDAWIEGVKGAEFKTLIDAKRRSIVPMVIIYVTGYMGLSVLAGFGRGILGMKVLGPVNLGFVLIAGNYIMSWALAVVYARVSANNHDPLVKIVVDKARASGSIDESHNDRNVRGHTSAFVRNYSVGGSAHAYDCRFLRRGEGVDGRSERVRSRRRLVLRGCVPRIYRPSALYGMDGALYAIGPLVAFCTVLLLIAEPLRNTGTYTSAT